MVLPDLNSTPPEDDVHAPGGEEDVHASGGEEDIHIQIYLEEKMQVHSVARHLDHSKSTCADKNWDRGDRGDGAGWVIDSL